MSTSNVHQQSFSDVGSKTRPPMLERGSYIPWASRFRRYLNRKRENRKWLNKAIDEGDDLKYYEAEIEVMNLILILIPNDIYNFVDACNTAKAMWERVERLMRGIMQNQVDRETHFNNEFDQFVAEPREEFVSYVTQVRLAKRLTGDSYDDLFDYLQQFEKLVNASRAKKLEKSHDLLALVAHTGSLLRTSSQYYVTHPTSMVDYDDDYQGDTVQNNSDDPLTSIMILLARDRVNIQSKNSGNNGRNTRRAYVQEEVIENPNVQNDAGNIQRTLRTASSGTVANVQCYNCSEKSHYAHNFPNPRMEEIEELSANICLMARIQPANIDSEARPSYNSAFLSKVQTPSTSYVNPLFSSNKQEKQYLNQPKIINNTIGDDQIDTNIIFDAPNNDVNSGSVEEDTNGQQSYELEQLARNTYREAEKQQIIPKKFNNKT
ncbi:hypothetical protein Tco_0961971 [Tanacetum coccineum]